MPSHTKKIILVLALLLLTGFTTAVNMEVVQDGKGFVGGQLEDTSNDLNDTSPLKVEITADNSKYDFSDIVAGNFDFNYALSNPEISQKEVSSNGSKVTMTLEPEINSYVDQDVTLNFSGTGSFENVTKEDDFSPVVYRWSIEKIENLNPGRELNYDQVQSGAYQFYMNVDYRSEPLRDSNFRLSVYKRTEIDSTGFYDYDKEIYKDFENKQWLKAEEAPSVDNANYKVSIKDFSELDENLDSGKYLFVLKSGYFDQDASKMRYFEVDKTLVDKRTTFSGVVRDHSGDPVRTEMLLSGDQVQDVRINTGENGEFSTRLKNKSFSSAVLEFYDRGMSAPDTTASLSGVELSENSDLGLGSSAIRYQYWENPESRIRGIESVNMMATKFAYPVGSIGDISMAFQSGAVNPEDIIVRKCDFWNFAGAECMESWDRVPDSEFSVNYANWNAVIDNVEPYSTPEPKSEDILMHAFIVGKRADLQLQESITVESTELTYNSKIGVSGVLVDESGNRVEDANMTLSLKNSNQTWYTTTDSTGSFQFDDRVRAEPGNYVMELTAEEQPYNSLSITSDATISISYEKGIETEAPADQTITQGEDTSVQFEVTNTGQTPVDSLEVSVGDLKDQFVQSIDVPQEIESGETETVTINLALPSDYCSDTCYPAPTAQVEGVAGEETVTASALLTTTLQVQQEQETDSQNNQEDNQQPSNTTDQQDTGTSPEQPSNDSNGITGAFTEAQRMTGNFIEQQSDLNIALGLIMIFTMILAAAVKKKQGQGNGRGDRMDDRSRPNIAGGSTGSANSRVQRPDVSSKTSPEPDNEVDESGEEASEQVEEESEPVEEEPEAADEGEEEDVEESEEVPDNVCDICGEEFENATGVKIHKQAMH